MSHITRTLIVTSTLLIGSMWVTAQAEEPAAHDHAHAASTTPPAPTPSNPSAAMQHMQLMHDKWMAAKTPAERKAVMAEHMRAMEDAMVAINHMTHGDGHDAKSPDSMQQHMAMMTMMMQMMVDREQMHAGMMHGGTMPGAKDRPNPAPSRAPAKP